MENELLNILKNISENINEIKNEICDIKNEICEIKNDQNSTKDLLDRFDYKLDISFDQIFKNSEYILSLRSDLNLIEETRAKNWFELSDIKIDSN